MRLGKLTVNHLERPLGYDFSYLTLGWRVEESKTAFSQAVRVTIRKGEEQGEICYDTGTMEGCRDCMHYVSMELEPRTRYYYRIWVKDGLGEEAEGISWFETAKETEAWCGRWIGAKEETERMPLLYRDFKAEKEIERARLYFYGAGLYEIYVNGEKAGDEYLQPGYHSYDCRKEYQTYDLTGWLKKGSNRLAVLLGEGWYKGRFGFDGDYRNLYGNRKKCIGELHINYTDGSRECVITDGSWNGEESGILENNIYDGEWADNTLDRHPLTVEEITGTEEEDDTAMLTARTNPPIRKTEVFQPVSAVEHKGEYLLLDFGESITGWVEWEGRLERNQKIGLYYGEVLQKGNFYRENLRTAKAEFHYISGGGRETVRPHFTYYGFRYVKVEGLRKGQHLSFRAYRLMSEIPETGRITTSSEKINKLLENTRRSMKCNFLDIPTDCPQRDERMGWTGDTAAFAGTACFHADSSAFYRHYARSLWEEQKKRDGEVPFFVPLPKVPVEEGTNPFYYTGGACAWADVATILPWTLYEYYGDRQLLAEQYPMMCAWAEYIRRRSRKNPVPYLWQTDRHLGDWLALDNGNTDNPIGKTDMQLLASAYYYYSVGLCRRAAKVLEDKRYGEWKGLEVHIKDAFLKYYYDEEGCLNSAATQTACSFLLKLGLYPEGREKYLADALEQLVAENGGHLNTGFVGTPVLCPALSEHGKNEEAYDLLLKDGYPGWLYEVDLGATTVWERWNSLLEDGTISGTGMNSLNHYAYGSIAEWMYRYVCGFHPHMGERIPMTIRPLPCKRLGYAKGRWESVYGTFTSCWEYGEGGLHYWVGIPFNARAEVVFPNGTGHILEAGDYRFDGEGTMLR